MKRYLNVFGMIILLIFIGLSGCLDEEINDNNDDSDGNGSTLHYLNIGDSIIVGNINYTFVKAYPVVRISDGFSFFTVEIDGKNIGSIDVRSYVTASLYEMENGNKYDSPLSINSTASFILSPGESKQSFFSCSEDDLNIDFSQIAKVYIAIDTTANIVLNVN